MNKILAAVVVAAVFPWNAPAMAKQADAVEAFTKATPAAKDALRRDVCQPSDAGLKTLGTDDDLAAYRAVKAALRNANVGFCKAAK